MALGRQAAALDGVGEHHGGAVVVGPVERVDQERQVVPAEVTHGTGQLVGRQRGDQVPELGGRLSGQDAVGDLVRGDSEHPLVLLVGHLLEAAAEIGAAGSLEQVGDEPTPLQRHDLPAGGREHALEALDLDVGHNAVQGLAVEVDHPQQLSERRDLRVGDGLPDGSFVQFGVAEQADEPAGGGGVGEVGAGVPMRDGGPECGGGADADRAGGEVDGVGVLEPAGVALQPTLGAQGRQVRRVEVAEQVVDGVQDGGGVWLDRDAVLAPQAVEPQRDHDVGDRRGGGLVPADLDAARVGSAAVGRVDDGG